MQGCKCFVWISWKTGRGKGLHVYLAWTILKTRVWAGGTCVFGEDNLENQKRVTRVFGGDDPEDYVVKTARSYDVRGGGYMRLGAFLLLQPLLLSQCLEYFEILFHLQMASFL